MTNGSFLHVSENSNEPLHRAEAQKQEAVAMLDDVNVSHNKAVEAVDRGSKTLKEANETYHILAGMSPLNTIL